MKYIVPGIITIIVGVILGPKSVIYVQEGCLGNKYLFGKVIRNNKTKDAKEYGAGFNILIPGVLRYKQRHVLNQQVTCPVQEIMMKDNLSFMVSGVLFFEITNVYIALNVIRDFDESLIEKCQSIVRNILASTDYEHFNFNGDLSNLVLEELSMISEEWGIKVHSFNLTTCAPTPESAKVIMIKVRLTKLHEVAAGLGMQLPQLCASPIGPLIVGTPIAILPSDSEVPANNPPQEVTEPPPPSIQIPAFRPAL